MEDAHVGQDVGRRAHPRVSATSINSSSLNSGAMLIPLLPPSLPLLPSNWNGISPGIYSSTRFYSRAVDRSSQRSLANLVDCTCRSQRRRFFKGNDLIVVSSAYDDKHDDAIVFIAFLPDVFSSRSCVSIFIHSGERKNSERGKAFIAKRGRA